MWIIAVLALWLLIFLSLVPAVTGTKGNTDSKSDGTGGKESSMDTIKQKKRSLNGHKLQLGNHARDCRSKIGHYKAFKSMEAREMVDRAFQKVMEQQIKCGEIFGELLADKDIRA